MRLLISGIQWPPETFLSRLVFGLAGSGVEVTVGSANRPRRVPANVRWLPTPSWDSNMGLRLLRLGMMAGRAALVGRSDLRMFAFAQKQAIARRQSTLPEKGSQSARYSEWKLELGWRLGFWNRFLPYVGRRWDVIYFPWNSEANGSLPVFDLGCPVVVSCRGTQVSVAPHNPERAVTQEGLRLTFEKAAAVHCVSEATQRDACRLGLDPAKARVIRPAVDPEQFQPGSQRSADGVFRVLTVGTLVWVKGYEWALQAIRHLVDQGIKVQYEIIGDGPDRQRVLYTIEDLALQEQAHWAGRLPATEVLQRLQRADAFLLSSLSEGISNAVLEAMACGLPVVTTDCGGMREVVTDGVEGFVVPVRDAGAMAQALATLAQKSELRCEMGVAARRTVVERFRLDQQIEQWLALYRSVLRTSPRAQMAGFPQPQDLAACPTRN